MTDCSTDPRGMWQSILPAFGIGHEHIKNRHGPCPGCGGKDRFRFDDKDGRGTWYCGGGGNPEHGDGYGLVAHVNGWDNRRAFREVQQHLSGHRVETPAAPAVAPVPQSRTTRKTTTTGRYALDRWQAATGDVATHPYATPKGIDWHAGARRGRVTGRVVGRDADCVVVPIRDIQTGRVFAIQAINEAGKKQTFGPLKGHGLMLGNTLDPSIPWYVSEGWATAVSIVFHHHHGNACCAVAFGQSNLDTLADVIEATYHPRRLAVLREVDE